MDFGLLLIARNPDEWRRPDHEVYRAHIERVVKGEELGFTHAWTSEHHFSPGGWSPSQFPILTAVAQRTEKIRLGTCLPGAASQSNSRRRRCCHCRYHL